MKNITLVMLLVFVLFNSIFTYGLSLETIVEIDLEEERSSGPATDLCEQGDYSGDRYDGECGEYIDIPIQEPIKDTEKFHEEDKKQKTSTGDVINSGSNSEVSTGVFIIISGNILSGDTNILLEFQKEVDLSTGNVLESEDKIDEIPSYIDTEFTGKRIEKDEFLTKKESIEILENLLSDKESTKDELTVGTSNFVKTIPTDEIDEVILDSYVWAVSQGVVSKEEAREKIEESKIENKSLDLSYQLTRVDMAKLLSEFAINVLGKKPFFNSQCSQFSDFENLTVDQKKYVVLSCELGIMGRESQDLNVKEEYCPNKIITRAEFGTALSRLILEGQDPSNPFYYNHLNALNTLGIIKDINTPLAAENKGYAILAMKRATNYVELNK